MSYRLKRAAKPTEESPASEQALTLVNQLKRTVSNNKIPGDHLIEIAEAALRLTTIQQQEDVTVNTLDQAINELVALVVREKALNPSERIALLADLRRLLKVKDNIYRTMTDQANQRQVTREQMPPAQIVNQAWSMILQIQSEGKSEAKVFEELRPLYQSITPESFWEDLEKKFKIFQNAPGKLRPFDAFFLARMKTLLERK